MSQEIVRHGEPSAGAPIDVVGGKGYNLLRLADLSKGRDFLVPPFFVIPVGFQYSDPQIQELYGLLPKPLAVRSSSPYEDSKGYSFAGMFETILNVNDFDSFKIAIHKVLGSANSYQAREYAQQHGISIDDRMAVIVQKMINPYISGVSYSTVNSQNPKTIVECIHGLSNGLMSGDEQGTIVSFDRDFKSKTEYGFQLNSDLEKVARVVRDLEGVYDERLDIEFAVSQEDELYLVQARPVTDPTWEQIQLPNLDETQLLLEADIVRGSGNFTGPAFVFRSPTEIKRLSRAQNRNWVDEAIEQTSILKEFDRKHPDGYCLIADTIEDHKQIIREDLSNLKALVTVNYASRFSHPIKIVSEMGVFYLGALGKKDLLDLVETGDTITVVADQSKGLVYGLTKPKIEFRKANLENVPVVQFETAMQMLQPDYEDVDDHLYTDPSGQIQILFTDYNDQDGKPDDVFYDVIVDGLIVEAGRYQASRTITRHQTFPSLLNSLLAEAKNKMGKK